MCKRNSRTHTPGSMSSKTRAAEPWKQPKRHQLGRACGLHVCVAGRVHDGQPAAVSLAVLPLSAPHVLSPENQPEPGPQETLRVEFCFDETQEL